MKKFFYIFLFLSFINCTTEPEIKILEKRAEEMGAELKVLNKERVSDSVFVAKILLLPHNGRAENQVLFFHKDEILTYKEYADKYGWRATIVLPEWAGGLN